MSSILNRELNKKTGRLTASRFPLNTITKSFLGKTKKPKHLIDKKKYCIFLSNAVAKLLTFSNIAKVYSLV